MRLLNPEAAAWSVIARAVLWFRAVVIRFCFTGADGKTKLFNRYICGIVPVLILWLCIIQSKTGISIRLIDFCLFADYTLKVCPVADK
ncbi:hypothetical protein SAMN05192585_12029 [Acetanaerobacterium elongatum]|uniref:Uncharacterized protein n=1 Tax=Acetanaerobacterium elongatum TaxID=258515 RepID=A0A1H0BQG1_9FIRM|nr:hypothetical protein SAMN05192585_12029 [Acetanaerobacterium elongatum]